MKKFLNIALIVLFAFVFTVPTYADSPPEPNLVDKVANTMSSVLDSAKAGAIAIDSSSITRVLYQDVKNGLTAVSQGAREGLSIVFDTYRNYYFWSGIVSLFLIIFGFGLSAFLVTLAKPESYSNGEVKDFDNQSFIYIVSKIISGVVFTISCVFMAIGGHDVLLKITAPEYFVIQDLLRLVQ